MKHYLKISASLLLVVMTSQRLKAQEQVIPASNRSTANLEKNLLFYADRRFSVSQSGGASFSLPALFDGNYQPQYSGSMSGTDPYNWFTK